jgi:hypothetical protein
MKKITILLLITCSIMSCNTYQWQKKRYYDADDTGNWNNYNKKRTEELQEKRIKDEYYKKE